MFPRFTWSWDGPRTFNPPPEMTHYVINILLTTALVVAISEASKRSSLVGGLLASLPPLLLKLKLNFYLSFSLATALMLGCYGVMVVVLKRFGVNL